MTPKPGMFRTFFRGHRAPSSVGAKAEWLSTALNKGGPNADKIQAAISAGHPSVQNLPELMNVMKGLKVNYRGQPIAATNLASFGRHLPKSVGIPLGISAYVLGTGAKPIEGGATGYAPTQSMPGYDLSTIMNAIAAQRGA